MITKSTFSNFHFIDKGWYQYLMIVCLPFLLGFQFMSCTPVIMLIYGAHQPNYVTDLAVVKFAHRLGLEDDIYRVKNYTEESRKQYGYLGNAMPNILLFNSAGQLTKFKIDCSGSLDSIAKLSTLEIDNLPPAGKTLEDFISDTYVINTGENEELAILNGPLYVVNFAEFAGLLNKNNVPSLVSQLSQRDDIQYVVLNIDYTVKK